MASEGFYIKKLINPRRPELNLNQNLIYHRAGKAFKIIDYNLNSQRVNNPNLIAINPPNKIQYRNSQVQNGQNLIGINTIKNVNQNLQNYNFNTFDPNEELKLNNDNSPYPPKALIKNYVYTNHLNHYIHNNNPKNIRGMIYNIPIINPNINQQQIFVRQNIVPVMQIPQINQPYIPVRRNLMINGFNTPNKNLIRRDLNTQRFNTIQAENRYTVDSYRYIKPLTERKSSNENQFFVNSEFSSKLNNNISTPIKTRALTNLYDQYQSPLDDLDDVNLKDDYQQYSNNTIEALTKNITINPEEQYNNNNLNFLNNNNIKIKSFSHLSRAGTEEDGKTKINQDSYIVLPKVNDIENFSIFAVLDGHGPHGHLVSKYVSQNIIDNITTNVLINSSKNVEDIYLSLKKNDFAIIKNAFITADENIKNMDFDVDESGTTCVLLIILGTHLICANVGDSRCILTYSENNDPELSELKVLPLSIDYKIAIPEERNRIIKAGGLVEQLKDSMGERAGPFRVFKPGKDYPGLAMSRSIGDAIAKKMGVIAEPGIIEHNLNGGIKFIVLGSDGIWEFLSNEDVRDIGKVFYLNCEANDLCEELYSSSLIKWKCNDSTVDDITIIAIYF